MPPRDVYESLDWGELGGKKDRAVDACTTATDWTSCPATVHDRKMDDGYHMTEGLDEPLRKMLDTAMKTREAPRERAHEAIQYPTFRSTRSTRRRCVTTPSRRCTRSRTPWRSLRAMNH